MATPDEWRNFRSDFQRIHDSGGSELRAMHQTGGWGKDWPEWYLAGAEEAVKTEFTLFAKAAATALQPATGEWLAWLNALLREGLHDHRTLAGTSGDDRSVTNHTIQRVCAASVTYCDLLAHRACAPPTIPDATTGGPADEATAMPASGPPTDPSGTDNRARIDAYLAEITQKFGTALTRADLWKSAGYTEATEFERWQSGNQRATHKARRTFEKMLRERPHLRR